MEERELGLVQDLVKCLSGIDLKLFHGREQAIRSLHQHLGLTMHHMDLEREIFSALDRLQPGHIYEVLGLFGLQYILACDGNRYLVAGPCVLDKLNEGDTRSQIRTLGMSVGAGEGVLRYLRHVPQISYEVYHQLGSLLVRWITGPGEPVHYQRVSYNWNVREQQPMLLSDQYAELTQIRRVELRYENSAALTEAVKCGNLSLAYHFLREMNAEADTLVRNPDPLRNRKNMCIMLNTQLRYALEEVGVHPFLLDSVSGAIGLRIEKLRSLDEAQKLVSDAIRQYCELVREHAYPGLGPMIHQTVTYIKTNLTENITVKETAQALLVNPDYLSDRFHKEMGITFTDFVNRERTAQAASLLSNTALQIQQVASAVGYNNTSYFSKQFYRFYQKTPSDFRRAGGGRKTAQK